MTKQVGRNDPCPCGSGKKFKACCWSKSQPGRKKFSAKLLGGKINLMERAFGGAVSSPKPLENITRSPIAPSKKESQESPLAENDPPESKS